MTLEGFDVFDRRAVPRVREPTVTIQKDAMFSLSQAAYEAMGKPVAVELLYNAKARMIALRATEASNPRSYPIRPQRGRYYYIWGATFTRQHDIDTSVARKYAPKIEDGVLIVDLRRGGIVATGARNGIKGRSRFAIAQPAQEDARKEGIG